ncbi:MAG: hypothetical protein IT233_03135 [Bacteroidia bacterium]|nr:hypothetical protein [Bacteroidia bacterium]
MMKYVILIFSLAAFASCKEPVPVYHSSLPGKPLDSIPYSVCGSWVGIDDVMKRELNQMQLWFPPNPDDLKYVVADTSFHSPSDTAKNKLFAFNKQSCEQFLRPIDSLEGTAKRRIKVGVIRIIPGGMDFEFMDSTGLRASLPLFRLGENVKVISFKEDYFIAQKTVLGWELLMLDIHHKNLMSIRIPWFTAYDEKATTPDAFRNSMKSTCPKLKPVLNKEGKIIGLSAALKPDEIIDLLRNSNTDPINLHRY